MGRMLGADPEESDALPAQLGGVADRPTSLHVQLRVRLHTKLTRIISWTVGVPAPATAGDGSKNPTGPSTYWIDAAVQVRPSVTASLWTAPGLVDVALPARPSDVLPAAGEGPWRTSQGLSNGFASVGFGTPVFLGPGDVLVLRAVGSGDG